MIEGSYKDSTIIALGHAGFVVRFEETGLSFAFDPYDIRDGLDPVDYVFVSHKHFDHCDPNSIRKLLKPTGKVVAADCCESELADFGPQLELVKDKDKHELKGLTYWTIPAYNTNKYRTPTEVFHTKELGGVGFVIEVGKTRFYHAGDTDFIPEMERVKKIDVAFLPISGTYVMTLEEAMQAAELIDADVTIPMHFGKLLGSSAEAVRFQNLLHDKLKVMVLTTTVD